MSTLKVPLHGDVSTPHGAHVRSRAGCCKGPGRESAAKQHPLGGVGSVDEVARAIGWLISPAASRTTGQALPIDGGSMAVRRLGR
jgi:NAD(P)-dependent dehydrogenase (short-subunit alcohol dehydrogenase family)